MLAFGPGCGRLGFEGVDRGRDGGAGADADGSTTEGQNWPGCVADVAVSTVSTCVLFRDGHVECAGQNGRGQLGDGTGTGSRTLVRALSLDDAVRLSPAAWGHCALRADESVWCWGDGNYGRLASVGPGYILEPTRIPDFGDVRDFEAGSTSSCVVFTNGGVECMGDNTAGQHGNGTTDPSETPVPVDLPGAALAVTSGWGGHAVILDDGQVLTWGYTGGSSSLSPTDAGVTDVVELSAHAPAFYARCLDGSAWAWGRNGYGQLGDGTTEARPTAAPVMGLADVQSIAGGGSHACAVLLGGEVRCWGENGARLKLGVEGVDSSLLPRTVEGLPPAVEVRAGQEHTCAIVEDGSVWCWGHDSSGQMGTGGSAEGRLPTEIPITCP